MTTSIIEPGHTFDNINPATEEVIGEVTAHDSAAVDAAVSAAAAAQRSWAQMSGTDRGRVLTRTAELLRERNDELAGIETEDTGKPIAESTAVDINSAADAIEYFAGLASKLEGRHYDLPSAFAYTRREPLGVCAGIGAWNYPIQIAAWKSAPALACGNAMVFKPSELTPRTAERLAGIYAEAGAPDGLFQVVQGGAPTGRMLCLHEGVAKVSFTGQVSTGKKVMADAASTLKTVTMELGGKSPLIIFDDPDLRQAVSGAMLANFYTQGEICTNGTRVFVHSSVIEAFTEQLVERTRRLVVGDPTDPKTEIGALISAPHMAKVLDYIARGTTEGAKCLVGGARVGDRGYFVAPTIFTGCRDDMSIVREEIFGPVLSLLSFDDEDEVTRRANDTPFGLASGVFTKDIKRAHRVAAALDAGTCWINNYNVAPIEMPFGGFKQSGIGYENSQVVVDHYTRLKTVYVELGDVDCPYD